MRDDKVGFRLEDAEAEDAQGLHCGEEDTSTHSMGTCDNLGHPNAETVRGLNLRNRDERRASVNG